MPRKRPRAGAAPADEDRDKGKDEKGSRKSVSGSGSRSAFTEMRRRAREVPSSDPPGRSDDPPHPEDKGAKAASSPRSKPPRKR